MQYNTVKYFVANCYTTDINIKMFETDKTIKEI